MLGWKMVELARKFQGLEFKRREKSDMIYKYKNNFLMCRYISDEEWLESGLNVSHLSECTYLIHDCPHKSEWLFELDETKLTTRNKCTTCGDYVVLSKKEVKEAEMITWYRPKVVWSKDYDYPEKNSYTATFHLSKAKAESVYSGMGFKVLEWETIEAPENFEDVE